MPDRAFIDTNIFAYINSDTDIEKTEKAEYVSKQNSIIFLICN